MKKRFLTIFLIVIFILGNVSAALPYKESLTMYNYKIHSVECGINSMNILVESKADANLKLMFKLYGDLTTTIFTNSLLQRYNTELITIQQSCLNLNRIEINGYIDDKNTKIVYLNSEQPYTFTGNEVLIQDTTTTTSTEVITTTEIITTNQYSYSYLNNKLLVRTNTSNNVYFHQDYLGSNRITTNSNGALLNKLDYSPFGSELKFSSTSDYKFTGKEQDSSNLYYFGARYYDKDTGRFTSIDPKYSSIESPYSYVANNPLKFIDPDGSQAVAPLPFSPFPVPLPPIQLIPPNIKAPTSVSIPPILDPNVWQRFITATALSVIAALAAVGSLTSGED